MINREWVTLLYLFSRHWSHQWSLTPWPTESEWHCFISLPGSLMIMSHPTWSIESEWHCGLGLINHLSSHDKQEVRDTALFLCQAVSSTISHPMANRKWVTMLYFFARQSNQSCLIPQTTASEWHCFFLFQLLHHPMTCHWTGCKS